MNQTYEEFEKEFLEDIDINAQIEGTTPDEYFLNDTIQRLVDMSLVVNPEIAPMQKKCRNQKIMSFDAYAFDESDKSLVLISSEFIDNTNETITMTLIKQIMQRMINFLDEAYDNQLDKYFDITDNLLLVGKDIGRRLKIDYVDLESNESIDRIKLIIITNKRLSERVKTLPFEIFHDKKVEMDIWSLYRFYDLYQSGREREPIVIETNKYGVDGIPCIKAEMSGNLDYDAYLAIVPGNLLHKIYFEHGSRLLEGNVRTFLSNRGKINKGIRLTIKNEPTKFFTYNNGIACTASEITLSDDNHKITRITDLQIINGGQTTASLTSAALKDKMSLDNIFVPMKLTVVKNDDYDTMIQNISKYANSQNKIKDSDLFSNHPFHRAFEALAKKNQAPAKEDSINNTLWFYERSRGQYGQEQFKLLKKSEKDNFAKKYPKNQVIKKEELSKYFVSAELLRPDQVCKGSEKCMSFFAEYIDEKYQKSPESINDQFFKNCICYAILFKETDKIVKNASNSWYITETYVKAGVVSYTISKLISLIPNELCLDYNLIWKKQKLYPSLVAEIERLAQITFEYIQNLGGNGMEQCKKEATWINYKQIKYQFTDEFCKSLLNKSLIEEQSRSETKDNKLLKDVNIETEIFNLGAPYWRRLLDEGLKRKILSPTEISLLQIPTTFDTKMPKFPSSKQAKLIWKIREKLGDVGVLID